VSATRRAATARPTMRDVAQVAGVSLKTVSRVINGESGVAVPTATRVSHAIAELGFQRNDLARSLRQGRTSATLGLLIEDVANPFYSSIAQAVEAAARARGYMLITGSCEEDPAREHDLVTALARRRVDALLIVPASHDHAYVRRELGPGVPAVFLDRPPRGFEADTVLLDNRGGARLAVEHLLVQGHRRIAFVSDPEGLYTATERHAGYRSTMEAAGVPVDPALVRLGSHDARQAAAVVGELLALPAEGRPTALFTGNNRHTVGAVRAQRDAGRSVALVGFDDFELADLLPVPITVVRHDPGRMGGYAAELAFSRLAGDARPPQRVVVPTALVRRGSGEIAP
jgi:LacI family transcriptional regulator